MRKDALIIFVSGPGNVGKDGLIASLRDNRHRLHLHPPQSHASSRLDRRGRGWWLAFHDILLLPCHISFDNFYS